MSSTDELKDRIEAKKHELQKEIAELKADSSEKGRQRIGSLEAKIEELDGHLRSSWDNLSDAVVGKLNQLLKDDSQD